MTPFNVLFALMISLSSAVPSIADPLSAVEVNEIISNTTDCCEIMPWIVDSPDIYGKLNQQYDLGNGGTLYQILTDHGASLPYYSFVLFDGQDKYTRLQFDYPILNNDNEVVFDSREELPQVKFDPETMTLSSFTYWMAGDQSERRIYQLTPTSGYPIQLIEFTADYVVDDDTSDHVTLWMEPR